MTTIAAHEADRLNQLLDVYAGLSAYGLEAVTTSAVVEARLRQVAEHAGQTTTRAVAVTGITATLVSGLAVTAEAHTTSTPDGPSITQAYHAPARATGHLERQAVRPPAMPSTVRFGKGGTVYVLAEKMVKERLSPSIEAFETAFNAKNGIAGTRGDRDLQIGRPYILPVTVTGPQTPHQSTKRATAPKEREQTLQYGEDLDGIAATDHTTVEAIIDANPQYPSLKRDPNYIQAGWKLRIPVASKAAPTAPTVAPKPKTATKEEVVIIRPGDTEWGEYVDVMHQVPTFAELQKLSQDSDVPQPIMTSRGRILDMLHPGERLLFITNASDERVRRTIKQPAQAAPAPQATAPKKTQPTATAPQRSTTPPTPPASPKSAPKPQPVSPHAQHHNAPKPAAPTVTSGLIAGTQALMDMKMGVPLTTVRSGNSNTWPGTAEQLTSIFVDTIARHPDPNGITVAQGESQVFAESGGRPDAGSDAGAEGIAQFKPETWKSYAVDIDHNGSASPFDPVDAIDAQVRMMDGLMALVASKYPDTTQEDRWHMALAAYNAGPSLFGRIGAAEMYKYGETKGYIAHNNSYLAIMDTDAAAAKQSGATPAPTPPARSKPAQPAPSKPLGGMRTPGLDSPSQPDPSTPEATPPATPPTTTSPSTTPSQPQPSSPGMRTPGSDGPNQATPPVVIKPPAGTAQYPSWLHGGRQISQHQAPWGGEMYSRTGDPYQTYSTSACEPTSMTEIVDTLTNANVTPPTLGQEAITGGFRTDDAGTTASAVPYQAKIYGLTATPATSEAQIAQALAGNSDASVTEEVIISGHDVRDMADRVTPFTAAGHYIVLDEDAAGGTVMVNDPNSTANSEKPWSLDTIWAHHTNAFIITE